MALKNQTQLPRRDFLRGLAAAPIALSLNSESEDPSLQKGRRVPMLQAWADESCAIVVILGKAKWSFKGARGAQIQVLQNQQLSGTNQVLYRLKVSGLTSANYSQIALYDENLKLIDTRSLKGLDLQSAAPKIAVASCANYRKLDSQVNIYNQVKEQNPDLIFFMGDIVYSNSQWSSIVHTPEHPSTALERYLLTWNRVNLYQLEPLIPTLAVWDDHDYGMNNGDADYPYKTEMQNIFRSFYPIPKDHPRISTSSGVSFRLNAFGIDFYFLDGRSEFRKDQSVWGQEQETWFANDYHQSKQPAWIINGIQFLNYFFLVESVEKNAESSLNHLKSILRRNRKPTVLLSGDIHCSQVNEISPQEFGYKTYEITSSGIHCNTSGSALRRPNNSQQLFYYGENNFLVIEPQIQGNAMDLTIKCAHETGADLISSKPLRIAL